MGPQLSIYFLFCLQLSFQTVLTRPIPGFLEAPTAKSAHITLHGLWRPAHDLFSSSWSSLRHSYSQQNPLGDRVWAPDEAPAHFDNTPVTPSYPVSRTEALQAPVPLSSTYLMQAPGEWSSDHDGSTSSTTSALPEPLRSTKEAHVAPQDRDAYQVERNLQELVGREGKNHQGGAASCWDSDHSLLAVFGLLVLFLVIVVWREATMADFLDRYFNRRSSRILLQHCHY